MMEKQSLQKLVSNYICVGGLIKSLFKLNTLNAKFLLIFILQYHLTYPPFYKYIHH